MEAIELASQNPKSTSGGTNGITNTGGEITEMNVNEVVGGFEVAPRTLEYWKEENKVLVAHGYKQEMRNVDLLLKYIERDENGRVDKPATLKFCLQRLQFLQQQRMKKEKEKMKNEM